MLPKKVLDLFPTFEYCCPVCSAYTEPTISFCPKCKTVFDEPKWRVPPRFLKNHKTMSEYAHRILAPKLNPQQRELLLHWFTQIFADGFETEDDNFNVVWTGKDVSGGVGSATVETLNPHHGSKNAKMVTNNVVNAYTNCYKTFSAQAITYLRYYVKLNNLPPANDNQMFLGGVADADGSDSVYSILKNVGGDIFWQLGVRITSVYTFYTEASASNPATGVYYCVEVLRDLTNQVATLWVDGVQKITQTGLSQTSNTAQTAIGIPYQSYAVSQTAYFDCVVVADIYIGPEITISLKYTPHAAL